MDETLVFNPPPGWPQPPAGWQPPTGWAPDPQWPQPPVGWKLWISQGATGKELGDLGTSAEATLIVEHNPVSNDADPRSDRLALLEAENAALRERLALGGVSDSSMVPMDDEQVLQDIGIYRYHHPLEHAAQYRDALDSIQARIVALVTAGQAIVKSNMFTFDNSLAKGRRMSEDLGKLMLRAYNSEADNSLRSLKVGNALTATRRLDATRRAIAKLGAMMEMQISDEFHDVRIEEIELTSDWLMKKQEERELEREHRAQLREERKVEKELAAERESLDKERNHLINALSVLREAGLGDDALQARLAEIDEAIAANDFRIANIRAGYVYVISNRGAFGDSIVKIGLTRRLEPNDRVRELSGASVPFKFDIHTLFFSEDAVTLENELHKHFGARAVNQANSRKEFFFATPAEVRDVLLEKVGNLLEFAEHADATEYFQSVGAWPTSEADSSE
ncbi:MAG: putative ATPase [Mycetocola sp.]|nr:putative ATPase [Mycetocola sp.]